MNVIYQSRIDQFKASNLKSTSEQLFGIADPPPYQCSNIDKVIKVIRSIEKLSSQKFDYMDEDDLKSVLGDIEHDLWNLESEVESIRTECENIREWGQAWKDQCKTLVNGSEIDLKNFI